MATQLLDQITDLSSFFGACKLMRKLGIDTTDVQTLEDAKKKLRIHAGRQTGGRMSHPNNEMISKIRQDDQKLREKVISLYREVREFLGRKDLPDSIMADLRTALPDLDQQLDARERSLKTEKCSILVAGETSAGKSTLLNLLLGHTKDDLLPTHQLSTTSVICELKYAEKPYAEAHPWPDDKEARILRIPLTEENANDVLSEYVYQKGERGKKFPYQKVEIYWPSEWLKAGVTIVDSPGIGESEQMTNLVTDYMPQCFGFIYVLASNNAGGIQHDRLQDMLLRYTKKEGHASTKKEGQDEEAWQLDRRSAIFVANKWELVPKEEHEEVKNEVYSQLHNAWPGLSQSQVFFLSAKEALGSMEGSVVNEDYGKLLDGLEALLPVGLKQRVAKHFSYLSLVMQTATRILKTYVTQLEVADLDGAATCKEVDQHLSGLEHCRGEISTSLKKMLKREIENGIAEARDHLKQPSVINHLAHWEDSQCPNSDNMEKLDELIFAYAMKRVRNEINSWDKENKVFEGIQSRIMEFLKVKFRSLETELQQIERHMETGQEELPNKANFYSMTNRGSHEEETEEVALSTKEKVLVGVTAPVWIPLGLVVGMFALPAYGIIQAFRGHTQKRKLKEYRANKPLAMEQATKFLLIEIMDNVKVKSLMEEKIQGTTTLFREIESRIPNMIKADRQMIAKLKEKDHEDKELLHVLYPLQDDALLLQGEIDLMEMTSIRSYDMTVDDLVDWRVTDRPVAQGAFAKVFKAKAAMTIAGEDKPGLTPCALKMLKDADTHALCPLSNTNASDALQEESNLRKLKHEHVVKYYGTVLQTDGPQHYLIMVMEFCDSSLETYIWCRDLYTPPSESQDDQWESSLVHATDLAWQIADGILGIHSLGFVHRDLKPANILMTKHRQIRLADLGLSKSEKKMSGTLAGTPLYMAPEIVSKGRYDRSADMFSYGLILWELWYGKNVNDVYKGNNLATLPTVAFRMERKPDKAEPWYDIMVKCWSEAPKERPDAASCRRRLADYREKLQPSKGAFKAYF